MATVGPYNAATPDEKKEPTRPLAHPSPSVHPATDEDDDVEVQEAPTAKRWRSAQYLRKRRRALCCCGCCVTSVAVVGIVVLVLALTVFQVKDPVFTMNRVTLEDVDGDYLGALNATLSADVSIKNPNVASFSYGRSETDFYYSGETVGVAYAPDGEVGAGRTVRMNVTLDALADRIAPNVNLADLIFGQEYNLTSCTEISGRVSVLGIYKRDLHIKVNCSITLEVSAFSSVQSKTTDCVADVK
ncbi:hypothetical protein ACQ4PT_041002 [Festuca glaucescens]